MDDQIEEGKKTSSEVAEDDLRTTFRTIDIIGRHMPGENTDHQKANAVARNILHEDLGYFGEPESSYRLDEKTRDRLIAHARQDASNSMTLIMDLSNHIQTIENKTRWIRWMVAINLVLTIILVGDFMEAW